MLWTKRKEPEKTPLAKATEQLGSVPVLRIGIGLGAIGLLWLVSQFIWAAVSGAMGMVALGTVAIIGIGLFQALPLLGQKWENWLLKRRKAEARANPMEQLQNFLIAKTRQVAAFKDAVSGIGTEVKNLDQMLDERRKKGKDVSRKEEALGAMRKAHADYIRVYEAAEHALVELTETIDDAQFDYKFAQKGQATMQAMNAMGGQDLLNSMLAGEAFDSIRNNFNSVFSELEMVAAKLNTQKQLDFGGGVTIDVSAIQIPQLQPVGAR
jgi:hypothetical protein